MRVRCEDLGAHEFFMLEVLEFEAARVRRCRALARLGCPYGSVWFDARVVLAQRSALMSTKWIMDFSLCR